MTGGCFSCYEGLKAWRPAGAPEPHRDFFIAFAVLGVSLVAEGSSLLRALSQARRERADATWRSRVSGDSRWEAGASPAIGLLLVAAAWRLACKTRRELIGVAVDGALEDRFRGFLDDQDEIDDVLDLLTMRIGPDSTLLAVSMDLRPGLDSEDVELACVRIKRELRGRWPELHHVFMDITHAPTVRRDRSERR